MSSRSELAPAPARTRLPLLKTGPLRAAAAVIGLLAVAGWIYVEGHAGRALDALPDLFLATAATLGFLAVAGYAPARLLTPRGLAPHLPLLVLPVGAASGSLTLTLLGLLRVPFTLSLVVVLAAGVVGAVAVRGRLGPMRAEAADLERAGGLGQRLLWPALILALIAALTLMPSLRIGAATVPGTNPDAHLVTGAAEVVRASHPRSIEPQLPVDRVSPYWRSKYPIYYSLAAVSELSGLDPAQAFPALVAVLVALFGVGVFLLAHHLLRAGPWLSLLAAAFVSLDRIVLYLAVHPYYNQLWGAVALPFMLLFGFRFLRRPDRRSASLTLLFLGLGVFAYPLMLPFPAVALGVAAFVDWRSKRARGERVEWLAALRLPELRRMRHRRLVMTVLALGALLALTLLVGVVEKGVSALGVIAPGGDLNGWQGDSPDYPVARYFGQVAVPGLSVLLVLGVLWATVVALRRLPREQRLGLGVMIGGALVMALNFRSRPFGEYFEFKTFAFVGPVVLLLGVVGIADLASRGAWARRGAIAALVLLGLTLVGGARNELEAVSAQSPPAVFELRDWARDLPPRASIRIDIPPNGIQLWAAYMLHERPLSARRPVYGTTYPRVRRSRKASYVLVQQRQPRPADATGPPVRTNSGYRLYRMDPQVPGVDRSSRERVQPKPGQHAG